MRYWYFSALAWALLVTGAGCHQASPSPAIPTSSVTPTLWMAQTPDQQYTGFHQVKFTTATNGWIAGSYYTSSGTSANIVTLLLRTTTGGSTWTRVGLGALNISSLEDICPLTDQVLYGYGADRAAPPAGQLCYVYKSQDAGQTWTKLASTGFTNGKLTFLTEQVGLLASANAIIKTTDGGNSWQQVWSGALLGFNTIRFASATTGYAVGGVLHDQINAGVLFKTTDQGATWQDLKWTQGTIQDAHFLTENVGFVLSFATDGSHDTALYKTGNGGVTWQLVGGQMPDRHYAFLSEQEFYCAGKSIQHTTNAGASWQTEYTIPVNTANDTFDSIQFPVPGTGYAVSQAGLIVKRL